MSNWALEGKKQIKIFEYDFAKEGGAVGAITLRGGKIPNGAVITSGIVLGQVAMVSGGATTVALATEGAADILAATGKASFTDGGLIDTVPDGAATNMVLTTAAQSLVATVAVAAITAGQFRVALEFYQLDDV